MLLAEISDKLVDHSLLEAVELDEARWELSFAEVLKLILEDASRSFN